MLWVKTTDLNNSFIIDTEEKLNYKAFEFYPLKILPPNAVLITMYGGFNQIGRTGILKKEATTNQAICGLIPIDSINSVFLNYSLIYLRKNWKKIAISTRKDPNITKNDIKTFQLPLPPLSEQKRIAQILSQIDQTIEKETAYKEKLQHLKKGLIEDLLTGKVRVKV